MSRDLTNNVQLNLNQRTKHPLRLVEIQLTNITLRYIAANGGLVWDGNVWHPKGIEISGVSDDATRKGVGKLDVKMADADGAIRGHHQHDTFIGKKILGYVIFPNHESGDDFYSVFEGRIEATSRNPTSFSMAVIRLGTLRKKFPRRAFTSRCPWIPGGTECNNDGLLDNDSDPLKKSRQATVISATKIKDPARVEPDDEWRFGEIEITSGRSVYQRIVVQFDGGTGELDLDIPIEEPNLSTVDYTVKRGCDGSWNACQGNEAWGATADNTANYGGFLHVEQQAE